MTSCCVRLLSLINLTIAKSSFPLLGSYTALSECNKAADAAKTAAAEAEESKNFVISNQQALLERIAALEERVQILEGN